MNKKDIVESLEKLSAEIEKQFNTVVLRKMYAHKSSGIYRTLYPIDNRNLSGKENNVFGPSFPKLKSFNDGAVNHACAVMIPVNNQGIILNNNYETNGQTFDSIIDYCDKNLGLHVYDGGQISMSYAIPQGMEADDWYSTKDTLLSPDIYERLGSVPYRRILYYV